MNVRILHCGKSLNNYNICIEERIAGFTTKIASPGDLVYLAVNTGKLSYCGARGTLGELTDRRPWENDELYPYAYIIENIEFCDPFILNILREVGGTYWSIKYVQLSKTIKDEAAISMLDDVFSSRRQDNPHLFIIDDEDKDVDDDVETVDDSTDITNDDEYVKGAEEADAKINIMGTFLTVRFYNEQHPVRGLETLVNENFYHLFDDLPESNTILIADNRKFVTSRVSNAKKDNINGVTGIPDAILIKFDKNSKCPLQINLIEYECYGEVKTRPIEKFNYLNATVIPQLMRFASTFSVATDGKIRESTIKKWTGKIIDYVYENPALSGKFASWIKKLNPNINEQLISLEMHKLINNAFESNLRVILIIDELTTEQRDTIKNVINSFKLESGTEIGFTAYVVRLEQRINTINSDAEYAISVQK